MPELTVAAARISELLHAMLHAAAGPNGQIHRIAALLETEGMAAADASLWLSHLGTATRRLDECLAAVHRYVGVFDLPLDFRRFALRDAIPASPCALTIDELPEVEADPHRVQMLFQELLDNAAKFRSSAEPQVRISASSEAGERIISVSDNGIGVEPDQRERIFRPFVQLSPDRFRGAGMGLAIARTLVETWRGRIWVEAAPGGGSAFRFTL